ncbi:MAG: type II secretion system F family protein [Actinomycetota bacterium]
MSRVIEPRPRPLVAPVRRPGRFATLIRDRARPHLPSIDHLGDRAIVAGAVASPLLGVVALPLVFAPALALCALAVARARRARRTHEHRLTIGLADVLDQLALAVGAGLTLPAALTVVAEWVPPVYRPLLTDALRRLAAGSSLHDAVVHLGQQVPAAGRRAVSVLTAAIRDGTPVGPSLVQAADEARRARRRAVETAVRRLPVLLLVPLVACVLPAFVLLTLVPLVLGSIEGLQLPGS